ncbi:MAG: hypothetical protein MUF54_19130 [Polyangiaceae bacterium]|nr:hypothetical protein [Polyangiaceae bacterium]
MQHPRILRPTIGDGSPTEQSAAARSATLVGTGMTPLGKLAARPTVLMRRALELALAQAGIALRQVDGLIAIPSLADPHFMEAHFLATQTGLLPRKDVVVRTIDTGGLRSATWWRWSRATRCHRCRATSSCAERIRRVVIRQASCPAQ